MNGVLQYVKQKVDERYHPDGYNIGINVNEAAGQSVSLDHNIIHLFLIKIYCDIDVKVISLLMQGISLHIGYRPSKWMRALAGEHIRRVYCCTVPQLFNGLYG